MNSAARVITAERLPPGTERVQAAIVGAGACGFTAAIRLAEAGVTVALLERDALPSGSTALSSGFIPAAGTRTQAAAGVHDSPERFAADIQAKAHGRAAPQLVQAYTRAIAPALDWLQARHGLQWELLDGFIYPGHALRRMHCLAARTGASLEAALDAAAQRGGAMLLTCALVRELWCTAGGSVLGVGIERPDGSTEHLGCDLLLLACNGYGGNLQMVREWLPGMRDAVFAGHTGNDGSAIDWGRQLGAALADLGACQGHGSWAVPHGVLLSWALMGEGAVQVNARGERFHDESQGYSEAAVQVLAQPGGIAWNVYDEALLALGRNFPDFREAETAGALRPARDVAALAALIGCDATGLQRTLAGVRPGLTDPFGRHFRRALAPPFHAARVTGALFHTQGGLAVDADCRVQRVDGTPLPNLLAAGGAARGVSGDSVSGYLSGNGLLSAVAGGYIAAGTAIAQLGASAA